MSGSEQIPQIIVDRSGFPKPRVSALGRKRSPRENEFLKTFLSTLTEHGLDNSEVVFSGFDGNQINKPTVNPVPHPRIWVMDQKCWEWALASAANIDTSINYAEYHVNPCIGAYDLNQLRVDMEGEPSVDLAEIRGTDPEEGICKLVTHIDYPRALPEAALRALVFFEYDR